MCGAVEIYEQQVRARACYMHMHMFFLLVPTYLHTYLPTYSTYLLVLTYIPTSTYLLYLPTYRHTYLPTYPT